MPAPVTFNVEIAPLPSGAYSAQELAQAIGDRITISPNEPWSSFVRGSVAPTSDVGPWLTDDGEWKVWSNESGSYVAATVDGASAKTGSLPLSAFATSVPKSLLITDADGKVKPLTGTVGQIMQVGADGVPAMVSGTPTHFDVGLTADQTFAADQSVNTINFDSVQFQNGVAFDPVTHRVAVSAGSLWYVYLRLQIEHPQGGNVDADVDHVAAIVANGATPVAAVNDSRISQPREGVHVAGLLYAPTATYISATISSNGTPSAGFRVAAHPYHTRLGGFRLA